MKREHIEGFLVGILLTAICMISFTIFAKLVWMAWENFMNRLAELGYPMPETEYLLGISLFIFSAWIGAIKLKKLKET